jgi:hypothetical protein
LAEARGEEYQPDDGIGTPVEERDDPAEVEIVSEIKGGRGRGGKAGASKVVRGRGKKKEEVGPSGQTYTPLEKQVSLFDLGGRRKRLICITNSLWRSRQRIRMYCFWSKVGSLKAPQVICS